MSVRLNLKNSLRNVVFGIIAKFLQLFLPFVVRTIVIYRLGIEYAGIGSLFVSIFNIFNLTELGIGAALNYVMYKPVAENDAKTLNAIINVYSRWYRNIGLIICGLGVLFTPFIGILLPTGFPIDLNFELLYFIYFVSMVAPYFIKPYSVAVLSVHQREDLISKIASITIIVQSVLQILAIWFLNSYYYFAIAIVVMSLLNSVMLYVCYKRYYPQYKCEGEISGNLMETIKKDVRALIMHKIGGTVLFSADNIVISKLLGQVMLGIYGNYYLIISSLAGFIDMILNSFRASVGNSLVIENAEENYDRFKRFYFWDITLLGVCTSVLLCTFQRFMVLWVGDKDVLQFKTMVLICILFYVMRMEDVVGMYRTALGLWDEDKWRPIISSICNIGINIGLTLRIGIDGVIISSVICLIVFHHTNTARILHRCYFQRSSSRYYLNHIKFDLINGIAIWVSCIACNLGIKSDGIRGVVMCALLSASVSACVIYLFHIRNNYWREFWTIVWKKGKDRW